jgi:hypothetical protein
MLMARPKPWAAPVTMAVLPVKSCVIPRSEGVVIPRSEGVVIPRSEAGVIPRSEGVVIPRSEATRDLLEPV